MENSVQLTNTLNINSNYLLTQLTSTERTYLLFKAYCLYIRDDTRAGANYRFALTIQQYVWMKFARVFYYWGIPVKQSYEIYLRA